ncbi:hypothetical protein ACJIZ3_008650 [Penstemon smallii]|uniref:Phytochrome chromophore attachment site domain-containing protein n=1 Tax=Penstemon smallii TaxID=265156 RepID=A0ABD3TAF8_9LAMI
MKNKVRMIYDCRAKHEKVVQDEKLSFDLTLCGSTLRAPTQLPFSHLQYMENMSSIASLVMSVVVNEGDEDGPSHFLAQVFAVHVNKELELENQMLRTQTLLCDMLLRDAPLGIVSQSPNVTDLVKCDGAALITDSLYDAGYTGALALGDAVCGMAAVKISDEDWLFWFRSHMAAEIRWGGAKHEQDENRKMHPRSSFKAFLEVVKTRSLPLKDYEMDAIHSLQLILRNAFKDGENAEADLRIDGMQELEAVTSEMVRLIETASVPILAVNVDGYVNAIGKQFLELVEDSSTDSVSKMLKLELQWKEEQNVQFEIKTHGQRNDSGPVTIVVNACASKDVKENVVGVCFIAQDITAHKNMMDKFTRIEGDYKAIVQNPNPLIPPIFGTMNSGGDIINKMLLDEVFGTHIACCRLKNQEAYVNLGSEKIPFGFLSRNGKYVECLLCVRKKLDAEGVVTGVFCFLHLASQELQQALHIQRLSEQTALKRSKLLSYIRREIRNPLSGIIFSRKMMEATNLDDEQKKILRTSVHCQRQLNKILDDTDLDHMIEGYLDLEMMEFKVHYVLIASISQVMCNGKVTFTPNGGQLCIAAALVKDSIYRENRYITRTGGGVPKGLLSQMFGDEVETLDDGIGYLREAVKSTFIISVELAISNKPSA